MALLGPKDEAKTLRWFTLVLCAGALATLVPFWAPLVLAAWLAILARPVFQKLTQRTGGRERAAGAILVVLGMGIFLPLSLATVSLLRGALELGESLVRSQGAKDALVALASGGDRPGASSLPTSPEQILTLVREHGAQALRVASGIAGAAANVVVAFAVFFYAAYVFLVDGQELYEWARRHVPFEERVVARLSSAFEETGRGLLFGVGLTALVQAMICAVTYFALGVPRALVLGFLTFLAAFLPAGTALIWLPVTAGLFLAGRTKEAIILLVIAAVIVGTIDNVLRPVLARRGNLQLSAFVLLLAMLGGFAVFGGWGLILGPLVVRLAKEALVVLRERHDDGAEPMPRPASNADS